jgi:hypothetical protein
MINKPKKPRDLINRLKRDTGPDGPVVYKTNSKKMATMAKNYHDRVQSDRKNTPADVREETIKKVLERTKTRTTEAQSEMLRAKLTIADVQKALKLSSNGKAPGLDGITYEVWKIIDARHQTAVSLNGPAFNIVDVVLRVYNDIETHQMVKGTGFSKSWMCPLYKKNDKADIANYRPISLLNMDYKVFTKALPIKLAPIATDLIHPDQAGFVLGRQIQDQIWLTKRIIELAEYTKHDGVIVALDQEKAYDKVEHDYLLRALTSYGIPEEFIRTIRALYSDAYTYVMVNGEKSAYPFRVTRGVRQGDPLSYLLFDLAIEPLAESLRQSDLKGYKVKGRKERLIATLFADDTMVYLDAGDDFGALLAILDEWCIAAGAKFNISKTEMIPIGTITHRDRVLANRFINGINGMMIPAHIKIAKEGEPIRTLGAWVGNGVGQIDIWACTMEKVDEALERWELGKPSMEGRCLIILMVVGGMTQYLATVQRMPKEVEAQLEKRVRKFLWAEKTSVTVNKETVYALAEMGGRDLLDIVARNEAIAITWLKTYLSFGADRPMWCFTTDEILSDKVSAIDAAVPAEVRLNTYLQSWAPKTSTRSIGRDLSGMLNAGQKQGLEMDAIAVSREIQEAMPVWYHRKSYTDRSVYKNKVEVVHCLQEKHRIRTVCDTVTLSKKRDALHHRPQRRCRCPMVPHQFTQMGQPQTTEERMCKQALGYTSVKTTRETLQSAYLMK